MSSDSKAPRAVLYIKGNATTTEAKIAEYQTIESLILKFSSIHEPIIRFGPNRLSKNYPITVGGRTKGSVKITSMNPLKSAGSLEVYQAATIPAKNTMTHEINATLNELKRGYQSIFYFASAKPTDEKISLALSDFRNSRKFFARSAFFEAFKTAAGYITGVLRVPAGGSAMTLNL